MNTSLCYFVSLAALPQMSSLISVSTCDFFGVRLMFTNDHRLTDAKLHCLGMFWEVKLKDDLPGSSVELQCSGHCRRASQLTSWSLMERSDTHPNYSPGSQPIITCCQLAPHAMSCWTVCLFCTAAKNKDRPKSPRKSETQGIPAKFMDSEVGATVEG